MVAGSTSRPRICCCTTIRFDSVCDTDASRWVDVIHVLLSNVPTNKTATSTTVATTARPIVDQRNGAWPSPAKSRRRKERHATISERGAYAGLPPNPIHSALVVGGEICSPCHASNGVVSRIDRAPTTQPTNDTPSI